MLICVFRGMEMDIEIKIGLLTVEKYQRIVRTVVELVYFKAFTFQL